MHSLSLSLSCTLTHSLPAFDVINRGIGLMCWVFAHGLEDQGSIPGRVIPKTQKMELDTSLLNT